MLIFIFIIKKWGKKEKLKQIRVDIHNERDSFLNPKLFYYKTNKN